jgi:hypothetical protein
VYLLHILYFTELIVCHLQNNWILLCPDSINEVQLTNRFSVRKPSVAVADPNELTKLDQLITSFVTLWWGRTGQVGRLRRLKARTGLKGVDMVNVLRGGVRLGQLDVVRYCLEEVSESTCSQLL